MTKTAADFVVAVAAALYPVRWRNRQRSFRHEGSGYVPADFQADKTHIIRPRAGFNGGAKKQALPAHHCETFNGGEGIKTIRQP